MLIKAVHTKDGNGYPRIGYPLIEASTDSQITRISGSTNIYLRILKKNEKKILFTTISDIVPSQTTVNSSLCTGLLRQSN